MKTQINNFLWMASTKVLYLFVGVVVTGLTARYLGSEDFGVLALAISFTHLFNALISMGLPHLLSTKFVSHSRAAESVLLASILVRVIFTAILYPFLLVVFWIFYQEYFWVLFIASSSCLFFALDAFEVYFDSRRESKKQALPQAISRISSELYKVFLIPLNASLIWFALFLPIWFALGLILKFRLFLKSTVELKVKIKQIPKLMAYVAKVSLPLIISTMSIMIYMQSDRIMIESMLGAEELGIYAAAATLSNAWLIIPTSVAISLLPNVISNFSKKNNIVTSDLTSFFRMTFLVALVIAILLFLLSDFIVFIIFGSEYDYASTLLKLMLINACFSVYGLSANRVLIALNYRAFCMYKATFSAILNVIANYILINEYGVIGAVFGTLIAELMSSLLLNFVVKKGVVGKAQLIGVISCFSKSSFRDVQVFIKGNI